MSNEPMTPHFDPADIDDLHDRLRRTRRNAITDDEWSRGVASGWLDEVLADWLAHDVGEFEQRLASLDHRRADLDGQPVHAVVAEGVGPDPLPLLLANGWPSSFCEYLDVLPLLTDPAAHGGDAADAFTVVVPSLPGFGFSPAPPVGGVDARAIADTWHRLMTEEFGHSRFVAHGSDLSARNVAHLARRHADSVVAIHLASPSIAPPPNPSTPDETTYAADVEAWTAAEGSYAHQHSTRPATLAAALLDSPAGLAAWVGEKFVAWSSPTADGGPGFSRQLLLDTLTLYWLTATIGTSMLPYWRNRHDPSAALPLDDPGPVPTAITVFGGEQVPLPRPTRAIAERYYRVVAWDEHERGGHFPAAAAPALFAQTLRSAFRPYR
jgi:pimeloyl-ACP methyl ester carboxylesterase